MHFSENSRVWIYQADRALNADETTAIQAAMDNFVRNWTAHNNELKAKAEIRYNRFLILIVDEEQAGASGCSIDKSVRFMEQLEREFNINLFDRFNLAYRRGDEVSSLPRSAFEDLIKQGIITTDTIVYNNLVQTFGELDTKWEVPFKDSWHARMFSALV